ncbi:MAG: tetratricopeptide repeat protein [Planctomycetota bacterium]
MFNSHCRNNPERPQRRFVASFLAVTLLSLLLAGTVDAQQENPPEVVQTAQTAANAQNAGDYEVAASLWDEIVTGHGDCQLAPTARYNAGVCHFQLNDYETAIERLKSALSSLDAAETEKISLGHLYLGFCQARLGKQFQQRGESDSEAAEQANMMLTTATRTFDQLMDRFPEFQDADQALFFQGEAYELLGRLDKAAESYESMQAHSAGSAFRFDGLFALGNVYEQLKQYERALLNYNSFRTAAEAQGGHELLPEVDFRAGATHLQIATVAANDDDTETAETNYAEAAQLFANAAAAEDFYLVDRALYQQAFCESRLGNHTVAAQLYEQAAGIEGSSIAASAAVNAGREYVAGGETDSAERILKASLESGSPDATSAAHSLARLYADRNEHQRAFDIADQWMPEDVNDPMRPELMMDRADAAYMLPDHKDDSAAMYLAIADQYKEHELAPTALYNAAFSMLEMKDTAQAITLADRFESDYPDHSFLPDALEVKAEAALTDGDAATAGDAFGRLAREFSDNEKSIVWNLRVGLCQYMQKQYQGAIDHLQPLLAGLAPGAVRAEALHWIGMSQFNLKQYPASVASLQESRGSSDSWSRADETLLTLSRATAATGNTGEAQNLLQTLVRDYSDSPYVAEGFYRLGELAYNANDFATALQNYQTVIDNHRESRFVPVALYDSAWSQLKQNNYEDATRTFGVLLEAYPDHELALRAVIGRGASRRAAGDAEGAINDFDEFLAGELTDEARQEAMYEKGLALIDLERWSDVRSTFEALLEADPDSSLADRYHYEIAWAARSTGDEPVAISHFTSIADDYPSSALAPESNFHKANALYEAGNYDEALLAYEACAESEAAASLREKAAYKLAWCYYKKDDYTRSHELFTAQASDYPEGDLIADAQVMIAESLYRQDSFEQAYQQYVVARPVVDASQTVEARVRWQALLHGGQSANKSGHHAEAIDFVQPIIDSTATTDLMKQKAWLEVGHAKIKIDEVDAAIHAWEQASADRGEVGAEARCMIGEALFGQRRFDDAINAYKLVFYGYGGLQASGEIRKWQAFAVFEAAQCNFAQIADAEPRMKSKLIEESTRLFNYLLENYEAQDERLTENARKQLETLQKLSEL